MLGPCLAEVIHVGFVVDWVVLMAGFLRVFWFVLSVFILLTALYSLIIASSIVYGPDTDSIKWLKKILCLGIFLKFVSTFWWWPKLDNSNGHLM
jgi:hypothetical protein